MQRLRKRTAKIDPVCEQWFPWEECAAEREGRSRGALSFTLSHLACLTISERECTKDWWAEDADRCSASALEKALEEKALEPIQARILGKGVYLCLTGPLWLGLGRGGGAYNEDYAAY